MAVYFVGQYPSLHERLCSATLVAESKTSLESSIAEVQSEMQGILGILNELEGSYSGELGRTFAGLVNDLSSTFESVSTGLNGAIQELETLATNLVGFKKDDETLEGNNNSYNAESCRNVRQYGYDEVSGRSYIRDEWIAWKDKLNALSEAIEALKTSIMAYKENCDKGISSIDEFNNSIVDIRLKMATIAFAQNGMSLEEIQNMTPEEKEKLINEIISAMTEKYNYYKAEYEKYINMLNEGENLNLLYNIIDVHNLIMGDTQSFRFSSNNTLSQMLELVDFIAKLDSIQTADGKKLKDAIDDYINTGDFAGSGLLEIYKNNGAGSLSSELTDSEIEELFLIELGNIGFSSDDPLVDFVKGYDTIFNIIDNFSINYDKNVEVGVAIKGLQELAGQVKYDAYTLDSNYQNYVGNNLFSSGFLETLPPKDAEKLLYMNQNEIELYSYLYDTKGKDAASEYLDSIKLTLNRREGYLKAAAYYSQIMSGENKGLDAAWDHVSMGATGYVDGMGGFLDGFVDLVAPSKELSANEYERVALLGLLTEGGTTYDSTLQTAYNVGEHAGKKTIPTLLNLVWPPGKLGDVAEKFSDFGNSIEDYYREDGTSHLDAVLHASGDSASSFVVDQIDLGDGFVGELVGNAVEDVTSDSLSSVLDYSFGNGDMSEFAMGDSLGNSATDFITGKMTDNLKDGVSDYWKQLGLPSGVVDLGLKIFDPAVDVLVDAGKSSLSGGDFATEVANGFTSLPETYINNAVDAISSDG